MAHAMLPLVAATLCTSAFAANGKYQPNIVFMHDESTDGRLYVSGQSGDSWRLLVIDLVVDLL